MDVDAPPYFPPPAPPSSQASMPASPPIDPLMQARLARLAANRVARDQPAASGRTTPSQPAGRQRKRHAAKGSRAAAVAISLTTTVGLSAYFQHADDAAASDGSSTLSGAAVASGVASVNTTAASTTGGSTAATAPVTTAPASAATTSDDGAAATPTTAAAAATTAGSTLADGTYTGATATNKWGPVQVEITVVGGQITSSVALQTPTDDRKSIRINERATPTLASEVLAAQSADIDTVSGATYTSDSYQASLQSAIDLAQATAAQATTTQATAAP